MGPLHWLYPHLRLRTLLADQAVPFPVFLHKRRHSELLIPILAILGLVTAPAALAQRGAVIAPESIDQLTEEATLIVHGHITSTKVEPHPQLTNLMTVLVTMDVEE